MARDNNCSYGKVTRVMVDNLTSDFLDFRTEIRKEFKELKETNIKLYNHLSNRLPPWALAVGGLGLAIISGLVGAVIKGAV